VLRENEAQSLSPFFMERNDRHPANAAAVGSRAFLSTLRARQGRRDETVARHGVEK